MKILSALLLTATVLANPLLAEDKPAAAPTKAPVTKAEVVNVTPDEAEKLIASTPGINILDVRTPEEFDHQHIKGAVNANVFDPEFQQQVAALDQTKPVIIHCQAGGRSAQALTELEGKVKFPKIFHLNSGFGGWKKANKPFESKPLPGEGRLGPGKKPAEPAGK